MSALTVPGPWFDLLEEGVVLFEGGVVADLNRAAAELLDVDRNRARGGRLIAVLRDHRLEEAAAAAAAGRPGAPLEVDLNGRVVEAVPIAHALLLRDRSAERASARDANELLAVLSHELRTPVAAIAAVLEALALDLPAARRDDFLVRAGEEAARLGRLVADLTLEVRPPRHRSVDLAAAVTRAVTVTETVRQRHGVWVEVDVAAHAVWADGDKLMQVLVNLIENAAVHGPDAAPVTVFAARTDAVVRVEVRDTGVPLAPGAAPLLFQTTSQPSVKARGTGLGLRIVASLVGTWGGEVWAGPRTDGVRGNAFGFSVGVAPSRS